MKTKPILLLACAVALCVYLFTPTPAASEPDLSSLEYATIRWGGRENTTLIRPNGEVEMIGALFPDVRKMRDSGVRVDERALCMTIAINAIAKEGYEVVSATENWVVLKRATFR